MRVLFYIEPHPLRDEKIHFHSVAKNFLPLLSNSPQLDARMFANRATFAQIKDSLAPHEKRLIRPTDQEEAIFDRYNLNWLSEGIPIWLELMAGTGKVSEDYQEVLERIWQRFPFDVIVHWGENGAVTRFIKDRAITRIAMELGCTRPPFLDSLVMDPYGTNGAGLVPKLSIAELRDIVGGVPMSRQEAVLAYSQSIEAKPYAQQFQPLPGDFTHRISRAEKLAFLPLQLFDDANLLRFSPYETLSDVVLDVVPKLATAGYTTIITPHPATKHRPQGAYTASMAKAAVSEWADRVIWLELGAERPENSQLIAMSDVVLTVNSSVGFEALYFDKPVVVLGDAVYKPRDLFPTLDDFLAGRFDHAAYLEGTGWLRRFFLGGYLQSQRVRSDVSTFERLVGLIDRLYRLHGDDPVAVAKGFWQVISPAAQTYAESLAFDGKSEPGNQEFASPSNVAKPGTSFQPVIAPGSVQWIPAARCLLAHTGFDAIETFTAWLQESVSTPSGLEAVVASGNVFNPEHYLALYPDVENAGMEPLAHYVLHGLGEKRSPHRRLPGVTQEELVKHLTAAADFLLSMDGNPLGDYPLDTDESALRDKDLAQVRNQLAQSNRRIAVVAHLYYRDLVPEMLERLRAIPEAFDLIVTLPTWGTRRIEAMVREVYPDAVFYHAANRGRDIGPFVDLLPVLLDKDYDAVLKIQTKRGYYVAGKLRPELGDLWREESFDALLGSEERVGAILDAFSTQPDLTMVGPAPHYLGLEDYPYHDQGMLAQMALGEAEADGFFAGTMFWVRPRCLQPLVDTLELSMTSFAPETGANDGALAHLIERLFGHAASAAGRIMAAATDPDLPLSESPEPLAIKMHERMEQALKEKRARLAKVTSRGALAW